MKRWHMSGVAKSLITRAPFRVLVTVGNRFKLQYGTWLQTETVGRGRTTSPSHHYLSLDGRRTWYRLSVGIYLARLDHPCEHCKVENVCRTEFPALSCQIVG